MLILLPYVLDFLNHIYILSLRLWWMLFLPNNKNKNIRVKHTHVVKHLCFEDEGLYVSFLYIICVYMKSIYVVQSLKSYSFWINSSCLCPCFSVYHINVLLQLILCFNHMESYFCQNLKPKISDLDILMWFLRVSMYKSPPFLLNVNSVSLA